MRTPWSYLAYRTQSRYTAFFLVRDSTLPWFCVGWACGLSYPQPPDRTPHVCAVGINGTHPCDAAIQACWNVRAPALSRAVCVVVQVVAVGRVWWWLFYRQSGVCLPAFFDIFVDWSSVGIHTRIICCFSCSFLSVSAVCCSQSVLLVPAHSVE